MARIADDVPSVSSYLIATAVVSGLAGYFIGQGVAIGVFGNARAKSSSPAKSGDSREIVLEDLDDDEKQDDLLAFDDHPGECKMTLVVRTDLGMGKGESLLSLCVTYTSSSF